MEEVYKNYRIIPDGGFGMKKIKAVGKGSVHLSLRGVYTNSYYAKRAIDAHIATKRVKKDDKTE